MSRLLEITFRSEVVYWRGPAPFYFVRVPSKEVDSVTRISRQITYGWGVLPADVTIGGFEFYTALFPKDGSFLVPLKKAVREHLGINLGEDVLVKLVFRTEER
jgi:hypothetical protein